MCESTNAKNLFETKNAFGDQTHIVADMFMACASVEITKDDPLPKIICTQCELKLSVAFEFKQQSEKTDSYLRQLLETQAADEEIEIKPDVNDYYADNDHGNISDSYESITSKSEKYAFRCKFCLKGFRSKNGYKLHLQKHINEKLHSCHICHEKFSKANLHKHLKSVHKTDAEYNTYTCEVCGLTFSKGSLLSKHLKEHQNEILVVKDATDEKDKIDISTFLKDSENQDKTDTDRYECKFCSKILITYMGLKIHERRHTGNNLHTCGVCKKTFTKSNHLKRHTLTHGIKVEKSFSQHMQNEHGISDESDVPLSNLIEKNESIADEETTTHQKENDANEIEGTNNDVGTNIDNIPDNEFLLMTKSTRCYTCHVCNAQFVRSNHLTRHMTFHKAVLVHKCDRCDKAFATPEFLAKHTQEDHIDKPYTCTICDKTYSRGEHLIRHLKVHLNPTEIDIKCSICEKEFTRSDQLARHIKLHLQQDKRHVCKECGKAFNRLDNLKTHQRIHTGQKDNSKLHLCIYCGKEFNNSSNMIVHMRRHTGERPYKCTQCGKGFPRSHDLKCHERTHSGEKPYICALCGKAFNKSNKLLRHTRVHTGERPYACNLCGRAFTQSNDLALHMRRHTGARPYACGMCPARFIQSGQLKAHRRSTGHWMETQPDLKGGHRVEPVVPLVDPVPIKFKTHGKKKLEEEIVQEEANDHPPVSNSATDVLMKPVVVEETKLMPTYTTNDINSATDVLMKPVVVEETKLMPTYTTNDMVTFSTSSQNIDQLNERIKSEVQNNCAGGSISSDSKDHIDQQNDPHTFQIYNTIAPTSTSYSYTTYQSFG
ncbi:Zinc finger, C2H2 type [Popillia japonica]|uniref:Zinc finger, C2H2 type n=1 Tax=Popillia japonica TaxID=7064 RepID=A0AAW1M4S2_POPJA